MADADSVAPTLTLALAGVLPSTTGTVSVSVPSEDEAVRLSEELVTGSVLWLEIALGIAAAFSLEEAVAVAVAMAVEFRGRVMV